MTKVRIYHPTKTAMQSGSGDNNWVLVFTTGADDRFIDSTMGWTSSRDMMQEVKLTFPNRDTAIAFATENNMSYEVVEPTLRKIVKKSYADNFI